MSVELVPEVEVKEISTETNRVVAAANAIIVADETGLQEATDILSWIAKAKKQVETKRRFFVKPLQEQVSSINNLFMDYKAPLDKADKTLRNKILTYRREQEHLRQEEEKRLHKLQEKEQKRLERQAQKKNAPPPPPPVAGPAVESQAKTIRSEMGSVSAREVWDFDIVDVDKIPKEFMIPNEKAIRAAVKAGIRSISGVRIFQREELSVRAR